MRLVPLDSSETISQVTIGGVPTGAILSSGTNNGDGTWSVDAADLSSLTITPTEHSGNDFVLTTSVTFTEGSLSEDFTGSVAVEVNAIADEADQAVTISTADANNLVNVVGDDYTVNEDSDVQLNINTALADTDGSETITSIVVSNVPSTVTLSAGVSDGAGNWTLDAADLSGLTLALAEHDDTDFAITVTTNTQDVDPETNAVTTNSVSSVHNIAVTAIADDMVITTVDTSGFVNDDIPLDITVALADLDGSESFNSDY